MERKIAITLGILLLALIGCTSEEGLYIPSSKYASPNERLIIKKDRSFVYYPPPLGVGFSHGGVYDSTIGTWKKKGKYLILNSNFQDTASFYFIESMDPALSSDSILIQVFDMVNKEPEEGFGTILTLGDWTTEDWTYVSYDETDEYGKLTVPRNETFDQIVFPQIHTRHYLASGNYNLLTIYVRSWFYSYFIDEMYRIEKDKLILEYNGHEYEYLKQ